MAGKKDSGTEETCEVRETAYPEDGQPAGLPDVYLSPTPVWK